MKKRHEQKEIYAEIAKSYGLEKKQLRKPMECQQRKGRKIVTGYVPHSKGSSRKAAASEEEKRKKEIAQLWMQVELLRNELSEAVRR